MVQTSGLIGGQRSPFGDSLQVGGGHNLPDETSVITANSWPRALERLVHVVPLGWEKDRAVKPILEMRAHRVYLLSRTDSDHNRRFLSLVRQGLAEEVEDREIREVQIDASREFESVLLEVAKTIVNEHAAGSRVHLNISASGKIASAGATLVGMYHSDKIGQIYYAKLQGYTVLAKNPKASFQANGLSIGYGGLQMLPRFPLRRMREASVRTLAHLYTKGPSSILDVMRALQVADVAPFDDMPSIADTRKARGPKGEKDLITWSARFRRLVLQEVLPTHVTLGTRGATGKRLALTRDGEFQAIISGLVPKLR